LSYPNLATIKSIIASKQFVRTFDLSIGPIIHASKLYRLAIAVNKLFEIAGTIRLFRREIDWAINF
jgi:hypothetical protein